MKKWIGYEKGINLGGWFSQCDYSEERFEGFIVEADIKKAASWGIDHVRIPIDYNLMENSDGTYIESGFAHLDRAINWALKYDLNVILDLHKTAGYSFDPNELQQDFFIREDYQKRFYCLWEEIAKRFAKYGEHIAFELLNEVVEQNICEKWNEIALNCIARIRKIAPNTKILIGGYWNNCVSAVKDLPLPPDENIIYNFHCYDPLLFTHQGAPWVEHMPRDYRTSFNVSLDDLKKDAMERMPKLWANVFLADTYEGRLDYTYFEKLFAEAIETADARNVPLYCGEYGVISLADPAEIVEWYKAINKVFVKYDIGRAAWTYKEMDFDLQNVRYDSVRDELNKYL